MSCTVTRVADLFLASPGSTSAENVPFQDVIHLEGELKHIAPCLDDAQVAEIIRLIYEREYRPKDKIKQIIEFADREMDSELDDLDYLFYEDNALEVTAHVNLEYVTVGDLMLMHENGVDVEINLYDLTHDRLKQWARDFADMWHEKMKELGHE